MSRADEVRANLERVRDRIDRACAAARRPPDAVTLIVITKNFPASDVHLLADLGVADVGENRHPEAQDKRAACSDLDLRWHFVGGLQSNKATAIASYADAVHSVDRLKLVPRLARGVREAGRTEPLACSLQVSLDPEDGTRGRSGVRGDDLVRLAEAVSATPELSLTGLMAVAPLDEPPADAFARLAEIRVGFLRENPAATALSAGMSGDLEPAVLAGATHVRVGRAVLGPRPPVK